MAAEAPGWPLRFLKSIAGPFVRVGRLTVPPRADVAVDARELRRGVHLHLRLYQLPLHPAQKLQRGAQVAHGRVFAFDCHIPAPFRPGGRVSSPPQYK